MNLLIDGTADDGTLQSISDFVKLKSGTCSVQAPFYVFDVEWQMNTDGPFPHLWEALAARAVREYLPRAHAQYELQRVGR